jgi:hypothetical protein
LGRKEAVSYQEIGSLSLPKNSIPFGGWGSFLFSSYFYAITMGSRVGDSRIARKEIYYAKVPLGLDAGRKTGPHAGQQSQAREEVFFGGERRASQEKGCPQSGLI